MLRPLAPALQRVPISPGHRLRGSERELEHGRSVSRPSSRAVLVPPALGSWPNCLSNVQDPHPRTRIWTTGCTQRGWVQVISQNTWG
jgi:hypothetical protein